MSFQRREPRTAPIAPEVAEQTRAADDEAREEVADRGAELLDRLRKL